jgi:hypothetical protein
MTPEVKRYDFVYYDDAPHDSGMEQKDDGWYVTYSDHSRIVAELEAKNEVMFKRYQELGEDAVKRLNECEAENKRLKELLGYVIGQLDCDKHAYYATIAAIRKEIAP